MKCNEYQDLMMKFFDKSLNDIEEARFKQHLKVCNSCNEEFLSLKEILFEIEQDSAAEPPENFELQVMSRIEKETVMYTGNSRENSFAYDILLMAVSFIFVILFGGILYEAIKHPIEFVRHVQVVTDVAREFFSAAITMAKGIGIAIVGVTASVYKTYYYAYILLGVLLFILQRVFFRMVRGGNGTAK